MEEDEEDLPKVEFSAFARALAERIKKSGAITLAEYMDACIPEYYATRNPFGKEGDFTTSPEVSQMFGELIGAWIADLWLQMGSPPKAQIVELGPGNGTLAADLMRALGNWPECRAAMTLHLVENAGGMRRKQAETLKEHNPAWYDRFEDVPPGVVFVIANEFIDALPVRQYVRQGKKWFEKMVAFNDEKGEFEYVLRKDPVELTPPKGYPKPIDRDVLEINDLGRSVVENVAKRIRDHGGAALFIDYGLIKPNYGDTMQSYKRHKRVDALRNPGGQDVTADVDFSALVAVAEPYTKVHGPVLQGAFLLDIGIEQRAETICQTATPTQRGLTRLAVRKLTNATDMGAKFKVLGLTMKSADIKPAGFADGDDVSHN
ncbi:MAG: class I SAM-dependent methyltransferase [Alphaproteobacteria bacterium]